MHRRGDIKKILHLLQKNYPRARIALKYKKTHELLIAVILSAQCTDKMVNKVTERLFKKYTTLRAFADAPLRELEKDIRSTGFYRNKARNIQATCRKLLDNFNGKIPQSMEDLTSLPGVARKTANIVLGNLYGKVVGIAVDTHVKRLSQRIGLTKESNPDKIEKDLMRIIPQSKWFLLSYQLIEHGRAICDAKKPKCEECALRNICIYFKRKAIV